MNMVTKGIIALCFVGLLLALMPAISGQAAGLVAATAVAQVYQTAQGAAGGCGCGGGSGSCSAGSAGPTPPQGTPSATPVAASGGQVQDVYVKALSGGTYDKTTVTVKAGVPVRFHFSAEQGAGCGRVLFIPDFNVKLSSLGGEEQVAEFTPSAGSYAYRCGMNMFRGTLIAQ